jgi:hypothetical protein
LRAAPRAFVTALRATLRAVTRAVRLVERAGRAGFDRLAFATVLLPFRTSFVASRFASLTAVSVPPTIASFAASAFAAIAPRVEPIDSATLTSKSCDFVFCDVATAGSLIEVTSREIRIILTITQARLN